MHSELQSALLLLLALLVKHVICDGPLQTARMVREKSGYGQPQGILHALVHVIGAAIVLGFAGLPPLLIAGLASLDGVIHYHVDYAKENVVKAMGWQPADSPFWWSIIADQALHHMTSILLVWIAFTHG
jgi:Protein of unknown function (DUF3307)